jgi:drug/metabolite transporter (DMT)-like permease
MLKRLVFSSAYAALIHYCVKYLPVSTVASLSNTGPVFIFFIEAAYYKVIL